LDINFSKDELVEMYKKMLRIRTFEETVYFLFLQGILQGTIHQCQGQEAVAVGICSALRQDDYIASNHRSHGHCLAKGLSVDSAMAELFARKTGCCHGMGGSMHFADKSAGVIPSTAVIGESIVLATGLGLAFKKQDSDRVAVGFFGDGGSNIGSFHEGINMGAIWKLPVIYVCENNGYAASTAVRTMVPVDNISQRSASYNIPGITVDGMDVLAVYQAAVAAVKRARNGEGPTLIECKTYRYGGHSRSDAANYRSREELKAWKEKDAIARLRQTMIDNGIISSAEAEEIGKLITLEINQAVEKAKVAPEAEITEVFNIVYA
jgi:TPP-dependent pyruvate/acetoin dehydrogenase alpha subunit